MTGVNTYAGGTIVAGGVLRFNSDRGLGASSSPVSLQRRRLGLDREHHPNTVFNRSLSLDGNGGIDVALHPIELERRHFGKRPTLQDGIRGAPADERQYLFGRHACPRWGSVGDGRRPAWSGGNRRDSERRHFSFVRRLRDIETLHVERTPSSARASFSVDGSKTLTLNGVVSGGVLTKADRGTLVLNGANTYSNTVIQGGTVVGNASIDPRQCHAQGGGRSALGDFNQIHERNVRRRHFWPGSLIKSRRRRAHSHRRE